MTTIKDFNKYIVDLNAINHGMGVVFRFDNEYGISLVCHSFSYGNKNDEFEIAIIKFNSEDNKNWNICYDTDITNDVLGYQSKEDVIEIIQKVINLK
jgi:hypothetical protein